MNRKLILGIGNGAFALVLLGLAGMSLQAGNPTPFADSGGIGGMLAEIAFWGFIIAFGWAGVALGLDRSERETKLSSGLGLAMVLVFLLGALLSQANIGRVIIVLLPLAGIFGANLYMIIYKKNSDT